MDLWSRSLLLMIWSREISLLPCRVRESHSLMFGRPLTPFRGVDAVIHVASPLVGRADAESSVDVGVTPTFPIGTSADVIHLRPAEYSSWIDKHPPSSHRRWGQTILDCK
jgi:hypothetical protein